MKTSTSRDTRWTLRWIDSKTEQAVEETCSTYRIAKQLWNLLRKREDVTNLDIRRASEPFDIW